MKGLAERFGLPQAPRRIEVYDNSHISGTDAIGAMIVAGPEGFAKNQYRKFNIKSQTVTPGDDYAMMREVLTRRFKRLASDTADSVSSTVQAPKNETGTGQDGDEDILQSVPTRPDLILIDGGAGQLAVARQAMDEAGISDIAVIGVAKGPERDAGREHFHIPGEMRPRMLEPRDPVLYFVQRLRDEAHRFAIGSHRSKRAKGLSSNPLDEIPGIGPTRRRALLRHFGSAKAVSRAAMEDLKAVSGISAEMAQKIYDFFHEKRG